MATWKRTSCEPLTTQGFTAVFDATGREGFVGVRWNNIGPDLFGSVYTIEGVDETTGEEIQTILDRHPHF